MLRLTHVSLLLPLHEVHSLESLSEIDLQRRSGLSIGAVRHADSWIDVLCLSDNLEPRRQLPATYRMCAILGMDEAFVALACSAVASIDDVLLTHQPLPACMQHPGMPIEALALRGDEVFCRTSAAELVASLVRPA